MVTPFVKRVYEQAAVGSIVEILCRYPNQLAEGVIPLPHGKETQ